MAQTRPARNRVEIDLLPPFGSPEVVAIGPVAKLIGVIVALGILLSRA